MGALARLPSVGLHGDLKLANAALGPGDRVRFIDWSMTTVAPVALELGWFLVSNSGSLPEPPERVLERYRAVAEPDVVGDWDAQVDLAMIVGLLLRGFRKGLDAEAGITLASGVPAPTTSRGGANVPWRPARASIDPLALSPYAGQVTDGRQSASRISASGGRLSLGRDDRRLEGGSERLGGHLARRRGTLGAGWSVRPARPGPAAGTRTAPTPIATTATAPGSTKLITGAVPSRISFGW